MRSATTGFRLCGIADEPFCPRPNGSSTSRDLGAREVADLERELVERRGDDGERREQLRVTVALEDLCRGRRRLEAEPLAGDPLELRVGGRVRADGAGELADAHALERARDARAAAVELERPAGELQPERRRLGVHAVRAADRSVVRCSSARAATAASARSIPSRSSAPASRICSASAVSTTSDEVSP